MPAKQLNSCPRCNGEIQIRQASGGRGTGNLTSYAVQCAACGFEFDCLGSDGTQRSAIREWNSLSKEKVLAFSERLDLQPRRVF